MLVKHPTQHPQIGTMIVVINNSHYIIIIIIIIHDKTVGGKVAKMSRVSWSFWLEGLNSEAEW